MTVIQRDTNRIHFIDYLRGFMVMLVVLEHALLPYAPHFKKSAYVPDFGGEPIFDIIRMQGDVIMIPMLFFLAGMFVLPSLSRRGLKSFATEKFYRLVVPFVIGVPLLVPPQVYFGKIAKDKLDASTPYFDWVLNSFFGPDLWSSAFWFLYVLLIFTIVLVVIKYVFPKLIDWLGCLAKWIVENPIKGVVFMCLYAAVVIGFCEIAFGRYDFNMQKYLGVFGKLMKARQSRFIMEISFFLMGAGFAQAGISKNVATLTKIGNAWKFWTLFAILSGAAYISYSLIYYYDGAYSLEIMRYFYFGGTWSDAWPMIEGYGGPILIRTTFMGLFMIALAGFYMSAFQKFLDKPHPMWQSLGVCSFGIYIFHETISVSTHYYLLSVDVSNYVKFLVAFSLSTIISWALTHKLRSLPGFNKVL